MRIFCQAAPDFWGGKLLTAAILAGLDSKNEPIRSAAEAIDFPAVELLDQINLMTYDCDGPIHSSYAFAESCLNYWLEARHFAMFGKPG